MRRRYLVSYDVADDKRRTKLFELLLGYGDHVQFSVFLADLSRSELVELRTRARECINAGEDQCLLVDLGKDTRPLMETMEILGKPYRPPTKTMII